MEKDLILVIGSSGVVGSEIVRLLKSQGQRVRLVTSKVPTDGDSMQVNVASGEGIREAFAGVDKAFLMAPPGYADQYKIISPLIQEAKRRGLKKVVLMTAMGANADPNSPFRRAEVELEKSGLNYNIIRPNWFLQNFHTFWLAPIKELGKILLPVGKGKASFIDARDIAAVAAQLLVTEDFNNKDFDITGPQALDHDEVAKEISLATGKSVSYQEIKPEDLKKSLLGAGLSDEYASFMLVILDYLRQGYNAGVTTNVKQILGREPRSIKQYTHDYKESWI